MAKKKSAFTKTISNRRARYDYALGDIFVVGIQLTGAETRSLRLGHGNLQGAYVTVKDGELWLLNSLISDSPGVDIPEDQRTRSRKLLATSREIEQLLQAKQQGNTIVPLEILTRGRYIKVRIAVGRGKKKYDKRQAIKQREQERSLKNF